MALLAVVSGLSGGSHHHGLGPQDSVVKLLGVGNSCVWSQVHQHVHMLTSYATLIHPWSLSGGTQTPLHQQRGSKHW